MKMTETEKKTYIEVSKKPLAKRIKENKWIYIFLLPGIIHLCIFAYAPLYGLLLAFKSYKFNLGIMGSPWVNPIFSNFTKMFKDKNFVFAFFNTLRMGFFYIITSFPVPIILAILINELRFKKYKKVLQTIYTFPNFLSWVIISGIMINLFSSEGLINIIIKFFGGEGYGFLSDKSLIRPILYSTNIWKTAGWSTIIYLAAITGINLEFYEAAEIDGANRFQKILYITWPGIKSTAVILLILAFGGIMNNGFDQILNMTNDINKASADIIDTYVYRKTFQTVPNYGYSTAIGLTKSLINFVFLITANKLAKYFGEGGIM